MSTPNSLNKLNVHIDLGELADNPEACRAAEEFLKTLQGIRATNDSITHQLQTTFAGEACESIPTFTEDVGHSPSDWVEREDQMSRAGVHTGPMWE